jgi:2-dehydro-3-deoxygluconokinase
MTTRPTPSAADAAPVRVALFGECMIELQGEPFGDVRQSFGGDTLNTTVYLARMGAAAGIRASYATALGDDVYSDGLLQRWQAEDVDTELVRRLPGRLPGLYAIHVDAHGERRFAYWRDNSAARHYFDTDDTPLEQMSPTLDALYFSGISLAILDDPSRARLLEVAQRVRTHGGRVFFDNNYRPRLWSSTEEAMTWFGRAYASTDVALVTADDERLLHGDATVDQAVARSLALPTPEVVVKRGAQPVLVRLPDEAVQEVAAVAVDHVVDTTAAGDSFAAGYLCARLCGRGSRDAARIGNRLAAIVIQHTGAIVPAPAIQPLAREMNPGSGR